MKRLADPLDLSHVRELVLLADIVGAIRGSAPDVALLLIGAFARTVLLEKGLGIEITRATRDIDLAIAVESWHDFDSLRQRLLDSRGFTAAPERQRLYFGQSGKVDLLPFAGIERADRTIVWPPQDDIEMSTLGFKEALAHSVQVILPSGVSIRVASPAALAALKLLSWRARPAGIRTKDASDLRLFIVHYEHVVGLDELYAQVPDPVLTAADGDTGLMAAWLLGRHIAAVLATPEGTPSITSPAQASPGDQLLALLEQETDREGPLRLAAEMASFELERNLELLGWIRKGLEAAASAG